MLQKSLPRVKLKLTFSWHAIKGKKFTNTNTNALEAFIMKPRRAIAEKYKRILQNCMQKIKTLHATTTIMLHLFSFFFLCSKSIKRQNNNNDYNNNNNKNNNEYQTNRTTTTTKSKSAKRNFKIEKRRRRIKNKKINTSDMFSNGKVLFFSPLKMFMFCCCCCCTLLTIQTISTLNYICLKLLLLLLLLLLFNDVHARTKGHTQKKQEKHVGCCCFFCYFLLHNIYWHKAHKIQQHKKIFK